jgi:hypothetical protein
MLIFKYLFKIVIHKAEVVATLMFQHEKHRGNLNFSNLGGQDNSTPAKNWCNACACNLAGLNDIFMLAKNVTEIKLLECRRRC